MRDKKFRKNIIWFWVIISLPAVFLLTLFLLISANRLGPIPSFEELENPDNSLAAEVYSEDNVLLGKFYIQNRTWTDYEDISPYVIDALIATEDIRFHRHSGIDFRGLARVLVKTIMLGQNTGGGSTITQQLAKNLFLPRDLSNDPAIVRASKLAVSKFKEWQTAVKLERSYTKEEIITMYLNVFDFIYNAVGINSAARIYFNTTPDSLNIEQSAMLVGMLKNSVAYNPLRNEESALKRRNVVISQMERYGYISRALADSVSQLPLGLDLREDSHNTGPATYFREYIRSTMNSKEPQRDRFFSDDAYNEALWRWQNDPLYGWCYKNTKPDGSPYNIYRDGLRIYTTLNSKMQTYAEEALAEHLSKNLQPVFDKRARNYRNPPYSNDLSTAQVNQIMARSVRQSDRYQSMRRAGVPEDSITLAFNTPVPMKLFSWQGERDTVMTPLDSIRYYKFFVRSSFMAMDPHTGHVKAYIGGPDFRYFKYDAVTQQKKQVGSTIKPFLYTLAMQDGYSPCYEVENIERTFEVNDTIWRPRSSGPEEYHGKMVTLKWGLAQSENYISAWLMKQFSPQSVVDIMHRMGIRSYIDPVVSIFLGTSDLSVEEMVGAYGTFVNKGVYTRPLYVTRIEDRNGNVISTFTPFIDEVISEDDAYLMTSLLQGVVSSGTAVRLRLTYKLTNQMGGKTGTTQNHSNGWFMGVMPDLVAGVWTGWEDQAIHFEDLSMGQGANMALPVFGIFMQKLLADKDFSVIAESQFEAPPGFNVDLDCDRVNREQQGNPYRQREY
ncbi:MAG: transglycosylase domain-containing protein [Bacteroidales bacterium]|jgi:penicillin-binding protein 1A|nr:transglycosylase domain-containing protein [Bacteroidales bacterium]MDX9926795.1 transglycosylase domain-containing protein [Bacteroidales bacterium]